MMSFRPLDLSGISVTDLEERPSKVQRDDLGRSVSSNASFADWWDALPNILGAAAIKELAARTAQALDRARPVLLGMGGHVVKVGLAPLVCDLVRSGAISAVCANGSVTIHDVELALVGKTSEDVDTALQDGSFGMSGQTSAAILEAISRRGPEVGLGRALGEMLLERNAPYASTSVLATCAQAGVPCTVHVAIGTDVVHMHPQADGAAIGAATHYDFRLLSGVVAELLDGGVYLNFGSAVVLPEVFLKAVSVARNLGYGGDFTTADFDFIRQYRPSTNVVRRPHLGTHGKGFSLTGHHELMFPLFWQGVKVLRTP
ncbi:MAG TPA: hypothetical protein VNJ51_08675 [Candidatus Dormibacteraeota bacterium]|nr:hypothetical protein [Candidatus Dormibacteraeota bacterium]